MGGMLNSSYYLLAQDLRLTQGIRPAMSQADGVDQIKQQLLCLVADLGRAFDTAVRLLLFSCSIGCGSGVPDPHELVLESPAGNESVWEYQAADDMWRPYSDAHLTQLEAAFCKGMQEEVVTVQGKSYCRSYAIDFIREQQKNQETGGVRKVRRVKSRIHALQVELSQNRRTAKELAVQGQQQQTDLQIPGKARVRVQQG